jgi:phospholipid/cholesterol/gamma-HCH transport system substrate-binding protein
MEKSRLESKVGLFVFIGLALLAALLIQFSKGNSVFRGTYLLKLQTGNVGGLKERAGVLLAGVPVGSVKKIDLDPSGTNVAVTLEIYKDNQIYHDARFVIEANGFLGDQYVSVVPTFNTLPLLTNGEDVFCEAPFNLQEVARGAAGFIQRLDDTAKKLDASVSDLRSQVLNAGTLANFGSAVTNLRVVTERALASMDDVHGIIDTNRTQVNTAVSNLVLFSSQLTALGDAATNLLATNGCNLTAATKNIQDITDNAKTLVTEVQAGKGLAGALLQSPQVATNIQDLAANLSLASSNLNRYGLWHFLWAHPAAAPATNSVKPLKLGSPPRRQ